MEYLAALLTGACLWLLAHDFARGNQRVLAERGGALLLRVRRGGHVVEIYVFVLMGLPAALIAYAASSSGAQNTGMVFLWTLIALGWIGPVIDPRRVELRERGMVLTLSTRLAFVPYRCVRYCEWDERRRRLFVHLKGRYESCSFSRKDADALTSVLGRHVKVRDASGRAIDVGSKPEPADPGTQGAEEAEKVTFSRFQFTMRTMLLAVLAASAGSGWYGIRHHRSRQQQAALAQLKSFKPSVRWDNAYVRELDFSAASKPGDGDLEPLANLTGLRRLNLDQANVTDAGLVHLADLKQLRFLSLSRTDISGDGLMYVGNLARLEFLSLGGTRVTDAGLVHLRSLKRLEFLLLQGTRVTDAGMVHLADLKQLESLSLDGTRITDAGLVHLRSLKQLESLSLSRTRVTDAGLVHLHGLSKLEQIHLWGTRVTDQGVAELRKALPGVEVFR